MPLLRAATRLLGGDGLRAGRLVNALLGGTGVVLTYGIARRALARCRSGADRRRRALRRRPSPPRAWRSRTATGRRAPTSRPTPPRWWRCSRRCAWCSPTARVRRCRARSASALLLGVAVLCHLTHVLLTPFVAAYLLTPRAARARGRLHAALALALGGALVARRLRLRRAGRARPRSRRRAALDRHRAARLPLRRRPLPPRRRDLRPGQVARLVALPLREPTRSSCSASSSSGCCRWSRSLRARSGAARARCRRSTGGCCALWVAPYALLGVAVLRLRFGALAVRAAGRLWLLAAALVARAAAPRARRGAGAAPGSALLNLCTAIWPAHRDQRPRAAARRGAARAVPRRRPGGLPRPLVGRVRQLLRARPRSSRSRVVLLRRARRRRAPAGRASTARSAQARARGGQRLRRARLRRRTTTIRAASTSWRALGVSIAPRCAPSCAALRAR